MLESSLTSLFKPTAQLVVYESKQSSECYIEYKTVVESDGKFQLSEGKPLMKQTLKKLLATVTAAATNVTETKSELMPENVLFFQPNKTDSVLIWYNKPMLRKMIGYTKKQIDVQMPGVIYKLVDKELSIFTFKSSRRPELKTPLFHLPIPNIYDSGGVCMGNVKAPRNKTELAELIKAWEQSFWGSEFTTFLDDETTCEQFKSAATMKLKFDSKLYKPFKKQLKDILK